MSGSHILKLQCDLAECRKLRKNICDRWKNSEDGQQMRLGVRGMNTDGAHHMEIYSERRTQDEPRQTEE